MICNQQIVERQQQLMDIVAGLPVSYIRVKNRSVRAYAGFLQGMIISPIISVCIK